MSAAAKRRTAPKSTDRALDSFDHVAYMEKHGHEEIATYIDRETGLRAMIALHDTTLGPGLGGSRLWHYESSSAAILDVLRLSEGMTYKAAVAGLPLGGAKAVILADGEEERDPVLRAERFSAFGRFVESLGGRYITAEDVGTGPADMRQIRTATSHVAGTPREDGGCGDPSPTTAYGVLRGMQALAEDALGKSSLEGVRIAVQGLGHVGMSLVEQLLRDQRALVVAADVRPGVMQEARERFAVDPGFGLVSPDKILLQECDIFAPCALGAVLNPVTIPQLRCRIVVGAANNQLADAERDGELLRQRGILYAVDYVVNAGGLIHVMQDVQARGRWSDSDADAVRTRVSGIYDTVKRVLERARQEDVLPDQAAREIVRETIAAARYRV
jgi:leucine dehydrogenase